MSFTVRIGVRDRRAGACSTQPCRIYVGNRVVHHILIEVEALRIAQTGVRHRFYTRAPVRAQEPSSGGVVISGMSAGAKIDHIAPRERGFVAV